MTEAQTTRVDRVAIDAWLTMAVLIVFHLLNAFDRTILSLMVQYVKRDMGVTDSQIGLMLGLAFALFYGIFGVPFGILVDRKSRRLVLLGGVLVWSLATIACGFAVSYGHLLAARMLLGVGEAALMPAAHSLLADKFPPARLSIVLSILYVGGVFGNSAAVAIGGVAVAHFGQFDMFGLPGLPPVRGWQVPFVILGVLGVVLAPMALLFSEPPRRHFRTVVVSAVAITWASVIRSRRAVLLSIFGSFGLYTMILYSAVLWTPTYMVRTFGWTAAQIGPGFALVHVFGAGAGMLVFGHIVDRLFARGRTDAHLRVMMWCLIIAGPIGIAAFLATDPYVFLILEGLFFFFGLSYAGYAAASIQVVSPAAVRGRMAAGYLLVLIIVGAGLGPWTLGILNDHVFGSEAKIGYSMLLMMVTITPIAIFSAWMGLRPMREAVAELSATAETPPAP